MPLCLCLRNISRTNGRGQLFHTSLLAWLDRDTNFRAKFNILGFFSPKKTFWTKINIAQRLFVTVQCVYRLGLSATVFWETKQRILRRFRVTTTTLPVTAYTTFVNWLYYWLPQTPSCLCFCLLTVPLRLEFSTTGESPVPQELAGRLKIPTRSWHMQCGSFMCQKGSTISSLFIDTACVRTCYLLHFRRLQPADHMKYELGLVRSKLNSIC
jgi:hypothetical protein